MRREKPITVAGLPERRWRTLIILAAAAVIVTTLLSACAPSVGPAAAGPVGAQPAPSTVTTSQLEERYGLRVSVLAVTAAGGMVDLRLKVIDAAKAGPLLGKQAPALQVTDTGAVLKAPADGLPQSLTPVDGRMLLVLFPNSGNAVKPGAKVAVTFGDSIRLEPLVVE